MPWASRLYKLAIGHGAISLGLIAFAILAVVVLMIMPAGRRAGLIILLFGRAKGAIRY